MAANNLYVILEFSAENVKQRIDVRKKDKLKSKKVIDQLFTEGKSVSVYPLKLVYLKTKYEDNSC